MSYQNKGETGVVAVVTSEGRGGNFTFASGADPALAIEAAWSYLNTLGGGTLVTKGAGETWITQSQIDSQGDDVHWMSDWSLMIQAQGGLDAHVVYVSHDRVCLEGLYLDGNHSSGEWGAGQYHGIRTSDADNLRIIHCQIKECHTYGISTFNYTEFTEIAHCWLHNNRWNNISLTSYSSWYWVHNNLVEETSDVGIAITNVTFTSYYINIHDNIIRNVNLSEGYNNAGWGIAIEGEVFGAKIISNHVVNCKNGIVFSDQCTATRCDIIGNTIDTMITRGIWFEGSYDCICALNNIYDSGIGIYLRTQSDCMVQTNRIEGCTTAMDGNNASVTRPMVMGNDWQGCTNDANFAAATNPRITSNIDRNGAWWGTGDAPN